VIFAGRFLPAAAKNLPPISPAANNLLKPLMPCYNNAEGTGGCGITQQTYSYKGGK